MTDASGARSGRLLATLMLAYLGLNVAVIVLAPLRFQAFTLERAMVAPGTGAWSDVVLNVALFVPLGFLLERWGRGRTRLALVLLLGVLLSTLIESLQLFIPDRFTTLTDIAANGTGALMGAGLSQLVRRGLGTGDVLVTRLFLDLPLVGLAWMLVPFIWLVGLTASGDPARGWSLPTLVLAGGIALAGAANAGPQQGVRFPPILAALVAGWAMLALIPALGTSPLQALLSLPLAVIGAIAFSLWLTRPGRGEQRVEPLAVRLAMLMLVPHLIAMAHSPGSLAVPDRIALLRALEHGAAFAVLGYAFAEWRGRSSESTLLALIWPVIGGLALLTVLGLAADVAVTTLAVAFTIVAVLFGATLYRVQRAHVMALRKEKAG